MHGGTNRGAPKGNRNAWEHGNRSAEAVEQLRTVRATDRDLRLLAKAQQGLSLPSDDQDRLISLMFEALEDRVKRGN